MPLCSISAVESSISHCSSWQVEEKFQQAVSRGADVLLTSGAQMAFFPC